MNHPQSTQGTADGMPGALRLLRAGSALLVALLILAGCSVTPTYAPPAVPAPQTYKEAAPEILTGEQSSRWTPARPSEEIARGEWWRVFDDEDLDALEMRAHHANQDLKAAAARLDQARALVKNARAGLYPEVNAGVGATRERPSPASQGLADGAAMQASTLYRAQLGVSYEVDLFGRVSATVDAATADAQRSEALFRSVLLALQADVAQQYFQLRELDAEARLFSRTVALREQSLKLVQARYGAGDISEIDVARAKTELASARSEALGVARRRAIAEHALAILLGTTPAEFSLAAKPLTRTVAAIPAGLPSALLERRPDIAAAERAMAAANARMGVAQSAFFPSLSLTGALGFESAQLGNLFDWSSRTFLLGPLVGTALNLPLFDGGHRQAGVDRARASYEEQVADYRGTVLNAFREVEDNLATLRILSEQDKVQDDAVAASERAAKLSHDRYREGSISYLDVIDADRSVLQQQRASVQLDGERARSTVNLIRALGGGWGSEKMTQLSSIQ